MKAVILAAGRGSRLHPVTKAIAKPLLPLANRMTIEYAFDQLKDCGILEICIVAGENEEELRTALGDGSRFGVRLAYSVQSEPLGLANALATAQQFIGDDDFALYLGDAIYGESLSPYVEQFRYSGASNLNLVKEVDDPRRFGVATICEGHITKLVEKPEHPESNFAMAGFYVFDKQIWDVIPKLKPSARGEYEITDAIQLLVNQRSHVVPGIYTGTWFDTGTLDSFLATSRFLTKGKYLIHPTAHIKGQVGDNVVIGENSVVHCSKIEDTVVLAGSKIKLTGEISHSLLGGEIHEVNLINQIRFGNIK